MSDSIALSLRKKYDDVLQRLTLESASAERDNLKSEIITLFKTVDQALGDLSALK